MKVLPESSTLLKKVKDIIRSANSEQGEWIFDNVILLHYGGSLLYGTATENSDIDIRGVTIAPNSYWVGAKKFDHFEYQDDSIDISILDIRKFISNITRVSPNVVESLFVPDSCILDCKADIWRELQPRIKALINQSAYQAYHGYSLSQLKKLVVKHGNKTGRQDLVEKYGMDTKFLAHGFRLANQGVELLLEQKITFSRPEAQFLLNVRNGVIYKPNELEKATLDLEVKLAELDLASKQTNLPIKANFEEWDRLLQDIYERYVR
jgi:hypothetical protein